MPSTHQYYYKTTGRNAGPTCRKCKLDFKEGDEVISKTKGTGSGKNAYHKACWEKLFH